MASTLSERVREFLRIEAKKRGLSHRDISELLGGSAAGWSASRVTKNLTGRVELGVDELSALCFALSLSVVEVVRDHGYEFAAEMTPTELRALQQIRSLPKHLNESVLMLIAHSAEKVELEQRSARPLKKKIRR